MDKKYQVFVSSTYEDLQEERQEVMHVLLELDCIPSGMELFPAANDSQWELIKGVIDDCDYYVVMMAEASERTIDKALARGVAKRVRPSLADEYSVGVEDDCLNTIIVQMRALGLIMRGKRSRSVKDTSAYWVLTPYGDAVMTRLRAIRSQQAPSV